MPWRYRGVDNTIEIVVDPRFSGDLTALAAVRPLWIIETDATRPAIEACWLNGAESNLCQVNRCPLPDPDDREGNLLLILGMLDDHYYPYAGIIVHGLNATPALTKTLEQEGFSISTSAGDTFNAVLNTAVRGEVIGRSART